MESLEAELLGPAKRFLRDEATPAERSEIKRIIESILCADPFVDNITKTTLPLQPAMLVVFDNGQFRIAYHHIHNVKIQIYAIRRSGDEDDRGARRGLI